MVSRAELYELVWANPMTKVAEGLEVSGSYLTRVCVALRIPRPERGYWAKLRAGKAPPIPTLPPLRVGDLQEWTKDVALPPPMAEDGPATTSPGRGRRRLVNRTHALIGGARVHFENTRKTDEGEYLRPYKKLLVDLTVSQPQLLPALEFANALFNALEAAGYRVALAHRGAQLFRPPIEENAIPKNRLGERYPPLWSPSEPTVVYVNDVPIGLSLVELSEAVQMRWINGGFVRESEYTRPKSKRHQVDHSWTAMRDVRSGRLRLIAYAPMQAVGFSRHWDGEKGGSLSDQIPSIISAMPDLAARVAVKVEAAKTEWQERRRQWEIEARRHERAEDRKNVQVSRNESQQHLERIISDWAKAISIDRFFIGLETRIEELPSVEVEVLRLRLQLAREFVGGLDPLQFFLEWKTPEERYYPQFNSNDGDD